MKLVLQIFILILIEVLTIYKGIASEVEIINSTSSQANPTSTSESNSNSDSNANVNNSGVNDNSSTNIIAPSTNNDYRQVNSAQAQSLPNANINNTSINNSSIGSYKIGEAVCSTSVISFNAYGGATNSFIANESNNYGGTLSLQIPLGGSAGSNCNRLAEATAKKAEMSNTIGLIDVCIGYAKNGVELTAQAPLELRRACSYIRINKR